MAVWCDMTWVREPRAWELVDDALAITTEPGTDLWQRTYYHFRNDNAPVLHGFLWGAPSFRSVRRGDVPGF